MSMNVTQIAVPTSVGYGAALGGISPLLSALTAGAPGVATVNIDNGFGGEWLRGPSKPWHDEYAWIIPSAVRPIDLGQSAPEQ